MISDRFIQNLRGAMRAGETPVAVFSYEQHYRWLRGQPTYYGLEERPLTEEEVLAIATACGEDYNVVHLVSRTGLRSWTA